MYESATVTSSCPACENPVEIRQSWTPGGMNDYGGYVLECAKCQHKFHIYLGRDIMDSRVVKGAKALDTYDKNIPGEKEEVLARHGLKDEG